MRTFVLSTFTLLLLTSVAYSQGENANTRADKQDAAARRAGLEQKKQKELDAQYKAATDRMKMPTPSADPWGDVRSDKTRATGR
jgi:hypothetical protein